MLTQVELEQAIQSVAGTLDGVTPGHIPNGENREAGYPFVRVEGDVYVYSAQERGRETMRRETRDLDELLWFVFHDITRQMASSRARVGFGARRTDSRRMWFPLWLSLMTDLKSEWGARTQAHIDEVLARNPYRDR